MSCKDAVPSEWHLSCPVKWKGVAHFGTQVSYLRKKDFENNANVTSVNWIPITHMVTFIANGIHIHQWIPRTKGQ